MADKPIFRIEKRAVVESDAAPVIEEVPEVASPESIETAASNEVFHACFLDVCITLVNVGVYGTLIVAMLCSTFGWHSYWNRKQYKRKT